MRDSVGEGPGRYPEDVTPRVASRPAKLRRKSLARTVVVWFAAVVTGLWLLAALSLVAFRWIDPPTTAVHIERRAQA